MSYFTAPPYVPGERTLELRMAKAREAAARRNPRKAKQHLKSAAILRGADVQTLKVKPEPKAVAAEPKVAPEFSNYSRRNRA